ncbi:MAG TPA: TRAP transporter small permease [Syntrophobacteraceae bacterium]|jgi:TRAP-type transport system small permease protein|nr:TRAP transporter small permease [Syntrophobacteraceae bacterium]
MSESPYPMSQPKSEFRIDHWIAAVLLACMASIAFINVVSRYVFHFSFASTEEITINMFVWLTVVGSGIAFERGAHLGMVTLFNLFPKRFKKVVIVFTAFLMSALFLVVNWFIIQAIYDEVTLFHAMSGALGLPIWIYYAGVPLLSVFVFRGIYRDAITKLAALNEEDGR